MLLYIAEKPQVAQVIAKNLNSNFKKDDGFYIVDGAIVTWCYGHLLKLYSPQEYDQKYSYWNLELLPYSIDKFKYMPIENTKKQLKVIINLIKRKDITKIVHAGDPDQEGQILVDEVLQYANNTKPVLRILPSDLTDKAIQYQLQNLKDNSLYKGLTNSGYARQIADWIIGMNLTVAYTAKAKSKGFDGVLSVGRVQSPLLAMIYNRDKQFESHKSLKYFFISSEFQISEKKITAYLDSDEKITSKPEADKIVNKCDKKNAKVILANHTPKTTAQPLAYSLVNLQIDATKLYDFSPEETLKITQELREKYKCITYNRSDCQYLPNTIYEESEDIINALKESLGNDTLMFKKIDLNIKSRTFNDNEISAHHAIIPTNTKVDITKFSSNEEKIYKLIAKRFIAQFYEEEKYIESDLKIDCEGVIFKCKNKYITDIGWTFLYKNLEAAHITNQNLSSINVGQLAINIATRSEEKETKPQPYYTLDTLLKDMTSIAKFVTDEKIKKLLINKDRDIDGKRIKGENGGIGTPATRGSHIENLFKRGYIIKLKKHIKTTELGRKLISLLHENLTKPDMTALWAEQQKELEAEAITLDDFINDINKTTNELVNFVRENEINITVKSEFQCKECQSNLKRLQRKDKTAFFWICVNQECKKIYSDEKKKPVYKKIISKQIQPSKNK